MPLKYMDPLGVAVERLKSAHDPSLSKIRDDFFHDEYTFFQRYILRKKVLVAGSGLGHDTFELARYNASVTGIEINPILVNKALELNRMHEFSHVAFVQGDFFNLPFSDLEFEVAVLNMGTIGTVDHPEKAIKELTRVAKVAFVDFYTRSEISIQKRIKMYSEEGWQRVRWDAQSNAVVSDDGLCSRSFDIGDIYEWATFAGVSVTINELGDLACIAEFKR